MIEKINFNINNINFCLLKTNKYKIISGIISFVRPLEKEDITYYTLINRLISSSCNKYPTKNALSNKMYELYNCAAYMSTGYSYKSANTTFVFSTIHNNFIEDGNLIKDIMFNPLI